MSVTLAPSQKLTDLEVGATARMLDAAVDAELRTLLRALGLTDNSPLRVCKCGEPCVVQVRATRIGISRRIAQHITVVPDQAVVPDQKARVVPDQKASQKVRMPDQNARVVPEGAGSAPLSAVR
jgi:Fe2+ transport system protein FeoA